MARSLVEGGQTSLASEIGNDLPSPEALQSRAYHFAEIDPCHYTVYQISASTLIADRCGGTDVFISRRHQAPVRTVFSKQCSKQLQRAFMQLPGAWTRVSQVPQTVLSWFCPDVASIKANGLANVDIGGRAL
jgi:hypothetical protein